MGRKGKGGRREEGKKAVEEIVLAIQNGHVFFFWQRVEKGVGTACVRTRVV